jgi:hypothetical protein
MMQLEVYCDVRVVLLLSSFGRAQLEWNDVDGYVDRVTVSSADIEAATLLLEKMCLALEDNMDYPVEHGTSQTYLHHGIMHHASSYY